MRRACIDIGSNTTRLLVADVAGGRLVEVAQERVFTLLGRVVAEGEPLPDALVAEVAATVAQQARRARAHGAGEVQVLGTAAVRRAGNAAELVAAVRVVAGEEVEILSPARESCLAFLGATAALGPEAPPEAVGVVDVGGGSTDLAVGRCGGDPVWTASPPLGSADVTVRWLAGDPPGSAALAAARAGIEEAFAGLAPPPAACALAVGGSATSLGRVAGVELGPAELVAALAAITAAPADVVSGRHDLDPRRAALLPAGILLLEAAARAFGVPLRAVRGGVREGALLEAADR